MSRPTPEFDFAAGEPLPPGLSVIEASAGTGKTYAISHLVPRLLLDGTAAGLAQILLVTFTNDAARELADRVRRVLERLHAAPDADEAVSAPGLHALRERFPDESARRRVLGQALLDIDQLGVSTIHSFCQRVLQTEGTLCGFPVAPELIPDDGEIRRQVLSDLWRERIATNPSLAAIATARGWSPDHDARFLAQALALDDFEAVPAGRPFDEALAEINSAADAFTDDACDAVEALLERVGSAWTMKAPPEARWRRFVADLRAASAVESPGFLEAVEAVAGVTDWISGRSRAGKRLKEDASTLVSVVRANEVMIRLAALRWDWQNDLAATARDRVASTLRANRQITYDGLISAVREALRAPRGAELAARLRAQYRVALIDESQDTDPRQFEIFRTVFVGAGDGEAPSNHRLVLIGDPKQAIYAFRGADVNTYLDARRAAGAGVFRLHRTYRSPEPLVRAVNAFFVREGSLLKDGLEFQPAESGLAGDTVLYLDGAPCAGRVEAWIAPDADAGLYSARDNRVGRIAETVASAIVDVLTRGTLVGVEDGVAGEARAVQPGDVAVLVNSLFEAVAVAAALHARGVPAIQARAEDVMASDEAAELLVLLRALLEPRRLKLRVGALATRLLGRTAADLHRIQSDPAEEDRTLDQFLAWQVVLERRGFAAVMAQIDAEEGVTRRLAGLAEGERRVTNLRQLVDLLQAASIGEGRGPEHLRRWVAQEIARAGDRTAAEERQQQLERDDEAVQLVTMHASKGLEYPLVFCPFLWAGVRDPKGAERLPRAGATTQIVDFDQEAGPEIRRERTRVVLEDRLRLAYVALTRAKVRVWIHGGAMGEKRPSAPSALDWLLRADDTTFDETWLATASQPGRGARHLATIERFSAETAGLITGGPPPPPSDRRWTPASPPAPQIATLPYPAVPDPWGVTSFSSLTRENHPHGGAESLRPVEPTPSPAVVGPPRHAFFAAPGGALVGTAVHEWIERWDFSAPDRAAVRAHFARYRLPAPAPEFADLVLPMLAELREARLPGLDCAVAAACADPTASEWHFHLPIHAALSPSALAEAFLPSDPGYARALAALPAGELAGFLQGFLDRIAFFNGCWGVIDWKTNRLGEGPGAYGPDALLACARQSHYWLQTHLYLVALRRFLGPEAPIAGAWLVFLRGVRGGTDEGVLAVNPAPGVLAAIDALFSSPSP